MSASAAGLPVSKGRADAITSGLTFSYNPPCTHTHTHTHTWHVTGHRDSAATGCRGWPVGLSERSRPTMTLTWVVLHDCIELKGLVTL